MSEIRSTIDLMMERTHGMTLSSEEKEKLREDDLRKRAKGFKIKLLEGSPAIDETLKSLADYSLEDRGLLQELIWQEMVENLPLDRQILQYLDLMEKLPQAQTKRATLRDIRSRFKTMIRDQAEDRHKILAREKKKLASIGISGSAVVPKIPAQTPLQTDFVSDLDQLKRALLG